LIPEKEKVDKLDDFKVVDRYSTKKSQLITLKGKEQSNTFMQN
jgi:hypothetical protein